MPALLSIAKGLGILITATAAVFSASSFNTVSSAKPSATSSQNTFQTPLKISCIHFSPDSKQLANIAGDRILSVWPVSGGDPTAITSFQSLPMTCIEWNLQGDSLFVGTNKQQILLCDPSTLDIQFRIPSDIELVNQVNFNRTNESLLSLGNSGMAQQGQGKFQCAIPQVWKNGISQNLANLQTLSYTNLCIHPENGTTAFATTTGEIVLLDLDSNQPSRILTILAGAVEGLKWSGTNLIASTDVCLFKIDASTGEVLSNIRFSNKPIRRIEVSSDNKLLFVAGGNETVEVFDCTTFKLICKLTSFREMVSCISLSPDGKTLAVGTCQGNITLWNTSDFQIKSVLPAGFLTVTP